jgi:cytosine/adenosine deaminase-related metal-dependent hydrolase
MLAAATRASALELIDGGVTALCDVLEAPLAGDGALDVEAAVLDGLGVRAALSSEACERNSAAIGKAVLEANAAFARGRRDHERISGLLCTHTSFTCSAEFMRFASRLAAETGVALQFHLNESRYEPEWCQKERGERPAEWYERLGVLGPGVIAAQGVQLSPREIALLAARHVRMVHVPLSNCEVGGGIAPVPELLAAGIVCGLGTDGYINDFLEVMRGAFLIHKGHRENPAVMDSRTVWTMATEGGADAVYPDRGLGRLAPGNPADFIAIDISDLPTPANKLNLLDQLILFRKGAQVRDVVVAGKHIKRDGALLTGNLAEARSETRKQASRLWEAGRAAVVEGE